MADKFKIYSYKAYKFEKKESGKVAETVNVPPLTFSTVPDWVKKTALFNWATNDGSIVLVGAKEEKNTAPSELDQLKEQAKELGIKSYGNMGIQKLRERIAEAVEEKNTAPDGKTKETDDKKQEPDTDKEQPKE